jgi:transcriptional regulator with XRE-family HTH domain
MDSVMNAEAAKRFATWLKTQRKKNNLSQKRLGRIVGCEPVLISAYENGRTMPTLRTLLKLIRALEDAPPLMKWAKELYPEMPSPIHPWQ